MKVKKNSNNALSQIETASNALSVGDNLRCEMLINSIKPCEKDYYAWV